MKNFLKKIIIFLIPVILFYLFPLTILLLGREYVSVSETAKWQNLHPESIFGLAYSEASFIPYKKLLIEMKNPTVLVLGSSRTMQIRKEFFKDPNTFVNASVGGESLGDIDQFIKDLPENSNVKFIILGVDQGMFYGPVTSSNSEKENSTYMRVLNVLSYMPRKIYIDYLSKKYSLLSLIERSRSVNDIGISAIVYKNGFRSDGSYKYGKAEEDRDRLKYVKDQTELNNKTILNGGYIKSVQEATNLNSNFEILNDILVNCKKRGITVIGFAPIYPQDTYEAMLKKEGYYHDMLAVTTKKISEIFYMNQFSFYDLSSPSIIGGKDTEFIDSIHGTDVMYLRVMIYLSNHSKSLDTYVSSDYLEHMLKGATGDFLQI